VIRAVRRLAAPLAVALALVSVGCGVPAQGSASMIPDSEVPNGLRESSPADPGPAVDRQPIELWFADDEVLVNTRHVVPAPANASAALTELLAGPTAGERSSGLRSAIPDADAVVAVETARGGAVVELSTAFADIPVPDQVLAVGQLVLTLTDLRGIGRVSFVVGGEPVAVPLPNGDTSSDPVTRDDYLALTST
jgi:spore germination protein GerM